jgi:hypothetical protein
MKVTSFIPGGTRATLIILMLCVVTLAGCASSSPTGTGTLSTPTVTESAVPAKTETELQPPPKGRALNERLFELVHSENRTVYAAQHGLTVRDGRVLVVVSLAEGTSLPAWFDTTVEVSQENERLVYVDVDDLVALAGHENVRSVRVPDDAYAQPEDESTVEADNG